MEPDGSLPHSKQPVTRPYPVSDQSSPFPTSLPVLEGPLYIIFLSTPGSFKRSPHQILYSPLLCPILVTWSAHLIPLNHPNNIFLRNTLTDLYAPSYYSPVISSLLGPNIFLSTLFPNTLSLCDQVSHPHKTTWKIFRQQTGRKKILHRKISWLQSTPSSFLNGILIR